MPAPKRLILPLLALAVCATLARAQQSASPALQPGPPAQAGPQKIDLDVVVTPKSGKHDQPVAGLQKQDFTVLDDNTSVPITSFQALGGPQAPVDVLLLVDAVNTNITNLAFERQQIDKFLRANGGHLAHPVELAIFTDTGTQVQQGYSSDGNQLAASLDKSDIGLRQVRRDTQYQGQDRFNLSINTLHSLIARESQLPGRKLIFWISPGWPLLSGPRVQLDNKQQQQIYSQVVALSTALRRANITLYSIDSLGTGQNVQQEFYYQSFLKGVKTPRQADLADLSLQVLADQTGGLVLHASNDLASHLEQAMEDTTAYYHISFEAPPSEQPGYHSIEVKLATPGLVARTRTGYYAGPEPESTR
jgi:VWFA-related protein